MIMYLVHGEPSYLPDGLFAPPRDEPIPIWHVSCMPCQAVD